MLKTIEDVKKTGRQFGQKIGKREAKAILALLNGRKAKGEKK